jgi:NTP pyrophosphatase (non-canonical NTP hydrolase)
MIKPTSKTQENVLTGIINERKRQDAKWGIQNHDPFKWLTILTEEVGEAAKAILEGDLIEYIKEMKQVAAVAVAALECIGRNPPDSIESLTKYQLELKKGQERRKQ